MGKYIADQDGYLNDRLIKAGETFEWQGDPKHEGRWFHQVGKKPKSPHVDLERIMMDGTFAAAKYKSQADFDANQKHEHESEVAALKKALAESNDIAEKLSDELNESNAALQRAGDELKKLEAELEAVKKGRK